MDKGKKDKILKATTFEELLDAEYGKIGTPERDKWEMESNAFCLSEILKEEREKAGLTQQALAEKIGTKKSYISRIENGKADVQLNTLFKIFQGLGKKVSISIL